MNHEWELVSDRIVHLEWVCRRCGDYCITVYKEPDKEGCDEIIVNQVQDS